jgi:hypothetical protein
LTLAGDAGAECRRIEVQFEEAPQATVAPALRGMGVVLK